MSNYANDHMMNLSEKGLTPELRQLAYDDSMVFRVANIENDSQRNLYLYLDNFIDDLLEEFDATDQERSKVLIDSFNKLKSKEDVDLTDIRKAVYSSIKKNISKKVAYPNFMGVQRANSKPTRDVEKWVKALNEIYSRMYAGQDREIASKQVMEGWSPMEKYDFNNWSKFYEDKGNEKYTIKTASPIDVPYFQLAADPPVEDSFDVTEEDGDVEQFSPMATAPTLEPQPMDVSSLDQKRRGRPKNTGPKTSAQLKDELVKKLTGAHKILYQFANVWPEDIWRELDKILSGLVREVAPLKTASTKKDCIIRAANMWNNYGFSEGADVLMKIADDVTDQIAGALEGKTPKGKDTAPDAGGAPPMDMGAGAPPADAPPEMPPAGAGEELPPPEAPPAPPEEAPKEAPPEEPAPEPAPEEKDRSEGPLIDKKTDISENPYVGKTVQDVVAVLEPTAQQLSERRVVREITKADMMLDALNIASHFPELGEAIAKMIESTLYVHTRLEKVISKLKGGLSEIKEEAEEKEAEAPVVEMGELTGKTPSANEKEMFEVEEEPTAPTGAPAAPTTPGV